MTDLDETAMPYFPAEVEQREREREQAKAKATKPYPAERYLKASGGRRACPHPPHRFAQVENSPASVILPECAGRAPWLAARVAGIGGSEVGALVGISEYETPFSIYRKKVATEPDAELTGAPIEWGHRLEDVVAEKTADVIGMKSRFAGGLWARRDDPVLRVTPDRFATAPRSWKARALIECKTAGDDEYWTDGVISPRHTTTGSAPLSYQAQAQWQMGIIGLPVCYLGCLVLGHERQFFTVEVHFDPDWYAELAAEAIRFWRENVEPKEPPMHDFRHPKTEDLLKTLHPKVTQPSTELPADADEWLKDLERAKIRAKKAEADLDAAKNFFRVWTGDAGAAYLGERKVVSYPEIPASRVDLEILREKYPEVAQACTVKSSYRRLTITVPKEIKAQIQAEEEGAG